MTNRIFWMDSLEHWHFKRNSRIAGVVRRNSLIYGIQNKIKTQH